MKIIIIGASFTGIQVAKRLINEKNDVIIIDNDDENVKHVSNHLDCAVIQADGNNLETLEAAGITKADALVCVTDSDEINMITCSMVDSVYPDLIKIARVRNYAYYQNLNKVASNHAETFVGNHRPLYGIDYMVHPDVEAAEAIVSAVEHGALTDVINFEDSEYELSRVKIEEMSKMDGIYVKQIRQLSEKKFIVAYVEDENATSLPGGDTILHAGNYIGILSKRDDLPELLELCGNKMEELNKIALVGAGRIGTIVAEKILEKHKAKKSRKLFDFNNKKYQDFTIIDTDEALCKAASENFPDVKVLRGDISDEAFVKEEGLDKSNLVICATPNHEMNMVLSAYLESLGVERTIALVAHSEFAKIALKLGVDVSVPISDTVVDSILSHLRGKSVTGVHTIPGNFETIECDILSTSKYAGKTLKEIASAGKYLILLVKEPGDAQYMIPVGDTVLNSGDHIVLVVAHGDQGTINRISGIE